MSDFFVAIVEMIARFGKSNRSRPGFCALGADYERQENRRSAVWVLGIIIVLALAGWVIWRWITG